VAGGPAAGTIAPVQPAIEPPTAVAAQSIGAVLAAASASASIGEQVSAMPAAAPARMEGRRDLLALVWLDRKTVPRIVRKPAWRRLLDALDDEPVDPEADDPLLSDEPAELEDQAQVFAILDAGAATDTEGARLSLSRTAGRRGKLLPPLELFDGALSLPFDEVETLKVMVSTATPLAEGDEALGGAIAVAEKFLASPGAASSAAVAEALTARLREVIAQGKQRATAAAVDAQVERALLEQRHYQRRKVLGGLHLRALLHAAGERAPLVAYLPAEAAEALPLAARFRARLIAAVHAGVDEQEVEPLALGVAALGRVVAIGR
jgi:hypothetical protein